MRKRALSLALSLCMLVGLLPTAARAAEDVGENAPVSVEAEARYQKKENGDWFFCSLQDALDNVYPNGGVVVLRDVRLETGLKVTRPLTLTSADPENPCIITYSPKDRGDYLLTVSLPAYTAVFLQDIVLDGGWRADGSGQVSYGELICMNSSQPYGELILRKGAVLQNNDNASQSESAGGMRVLGGNVYMEAGSVIQNCRATAGGGAAVANANGVLYFQGGTIRSCEAVFGGGVYATNNGKLRLYGGSIQGNKARKELDGHPQSTATGRGSGGGIYIDYGYAYMLLKGPNDPGVLIADNDAALSGGGIFVRAGLLQLFAGTITGNTAGNSGGGVLFTPEYGRSILALGCTPVVGGNTVGGEPDNLFLDGERVAPPDPDYTIPMTIGQGMWPNASIGVSRWVKPNDQFSYRVVAVPNPGYTITENDLSKFHSDDPLYATLLHSAPGGADDGTIVITRADVAFDNCGHGVRPPSEFIDTQGKVPAPEELQADGYEFLGWFTEKENGTQWNFTEDSVTTDEKPQFLYAHWSPIEYDILYDLAGGTNDAGNPLHYNIESADITLKPPVREGYRFLGWQEVPVEETASLLAVRPEEDRMADIPTGSFGVKKFVAQWKEADPCTVTYEDGVGGAAFPPEAHSGRLLWSATPPFGGGTPTRTGYSFTGWTPAVSETVTADATYTAQWEAVRYSVTYELGGGVNAEGNPTGYTVESGDIPLKAPTKEHYTFTGWTWPGQDVPQAQAVLPAGSTGTMVYTAHWRANSYPVRYDVQGHGAAPAEQNVAYGGKAAAPEDPAESGWIFGGWYKEPSCETSWNFDADTVTGPVTLYAKWTLEPIPARPSRPKPDPAEETPPPSPPTLERAEHFAYLVGFPDGTVRPEANITRAEAATVFFRLMTEESRRENRSETNPFPDVTEGCWYHSAVSTGLRAGLIRGLPDGTFGGGRPITRAEFAAIAARFLSDETAPDSGFADLEGHWAREEVDRAVAAGWIKGYPDGNFHPHDYITRAQVVTLVNRMLNRTPSAEGMDADMLRWPDNPTTAWYYADVQEATNGHTYRRDSQSGAETWTGLIPGRVLPDTPGRAW